MTTLSFRRATLDDALILFDWVNSPDGLSSKLETREPISLETHMAWFETRINDEDTGIWLTEVEGRLAGQVRLQLVEDAMDIDVFIIPEQRRNGIARRLLDFADKEGQRLWPNRSLVARIRHENMESKKLFISCGYQLAEVRDEHIVMFLHAKSDWWKNPRKVRIVIDNPSWIAPYIETLADRIRQTGDSVKLTDTYNSLECADVTFLIGCVNLAPTSFLCSSKITLVVHESNLPAGRGFSPLTWKILEGDNAVPICLLHAVSHADAGPIVYREELAFDGHELIQELRERQAQTTVELCLRYLAEPRPEIGEMQNGDATHYRRRTMQDSKLDVNQSLADQFDLLRTVDNNRYPAHFEFRDHTYIIEIKKRDRI